MELKEFVAETLKQVVEGVAQAQQDVKELGATINPKGVVYQQGQSYVSPSSRKTIQMIDFDISLAETESTQAGGRIAVFFGTVAGGAHGKAESGSNAMNRVKFSVPIVLPTYACPP